MANDINKQIWKKERKKQKTVRKKKIKLRKKEDRRGRNKPTTIKN